MKLIVSGGLRVDYLITADGEVRIREIGGNAVYAASAARLWVDRVTLLAKVGENYPEEWLARLREDGLQTDGVYRVPGSHEQRTFYAYLDPHTRVDHDPAAHFARVGHPLPPELEDYEDSLVGQRDQSGNPLMLRDEDILPDMSGAEAAHIAPMGIVTQRELSTGFKRRGVAQVTLDPGEYVGSPENIPMIREMCASVDAILPSELEMGLLLGTVSPHEAAEILAGWGAPLVVIKRGSKGVLLYLADARRFIEVPAYPTKVVDVTGAGDSFCGGFCVGLKQSGDPVRAALMGIVSASFAIEAYGARHALSVPRPLARRRLEEMAQVVLT